MLYELPTFLHQFRMCPLRPEWTTVLLVRNPIEAEIMTVDELLGVAEGVGQLLLRYARGGVE